MEFYKRIDKALSEKNGLETHRDVEWRQNVLERYTWKQKCVWKMLTTIFGKSALSQGYENKLRISWMITEHIF